MTDPLSQTIDRIQRIKKRAAWLELAINWLRALVLGGMTLALWSFVRPDSGIESLILALLVAVLSLTLCQRRRTRTVFPDDLILAMEIECPDAPYAATTFATEKAGSPRTKAWQEWAEQHLRSLKTYEKSRLWRQATTLVVPFLMTLIALPDRAPSLSHALSEVGEVMARLHQGAHLRIIQGATKDEQTGQDIPLKKGGVANIELLAQNMLEIKVTGASRREPPTIELRQQQVSAATPRAAPVFQSFQMIPVRDANDPNRAGDQETDRYMISFAVSEPVELVIPSISSEKLAFLKVQQLPVPKVNLSLTSPPEDPWPDDQPLGLRIHVSAENPLQLVRLLIRSGKQESKELVANVLAEDKTELDTDYRLILETYVESDLAEVEIIAEAIDRALPAPLIGRSQPLKLKTASAYGRYRETLNTLRSIKKHVDDAITRGHKKLSKEAEELAKKSVQQSEKSPFFDGRDRVTVMNIESKIAAMAANQNLEYLLTLSTELNDFLFEHELLDDRERDRDFFVAARSLSRLIEQVPSKRPLATDKVTARIKRFLDDRLERWTKRVARLPSSDVPEIWSEVRRKAFQAAMTRIDAAASPGVESPSVAPAQLEILSKTVTSYRAWIEDLEAKEDQFREREESERQQGLASARNVLRELQQRQGDITENLDRSSERPQAELEAVWPGARLQQNANVRDARQLEGQLRSLSPNANARILAAIAAMEGTTNAGNAAQFSAAESNSDMAGRLLRQAERDTQESQQKRQNHGRRRRVTGDNYYGQSVVGGDVEIKREYEVDRRYREDILDEIQQAGYDDEQRSLLENYLRHVVR